MPKPPTQTPTTKALSLPEILETILTFIDKDTASTWTDKNNYKYSRAGVLLRCSLVNKFWNAEAMRILWSNMLTNEMRLDEVIDRISPERRQFYADYIKTAFIHTHMWDTEWVVQRAWMRFLFRGFAFLGFIRIFWDAERRIRVPVVYMPHLETLEIWGTLEGAEVLWKLDVEQWDDLAVQIPKLFPTLLHVNIQLPTLKYPDGLAALYESLPKVRDITLGEVFNDEE